MCPHKEKIAEITYTSTEANGGSPEKIFIRRVDALEGPAYQTKLKPTKETTLNELELQMKNNPFFSVETIDSKY